jgi:anthranilate synthase component I
MIEFLSKKDFITLANQSSRVIVTKEILADQITPVLAFQALRSQMKGATLLESSLPETQGRQFSFIGFNPREVLLADTLDQIRNFYRNQQAMGAQINPGLAGGITALFPYDTAKLFEEKLNQEKISPIVLKSYQDHILFDHNESTLLFSTLVTVDLENIDALYEQAVQRLNHIHRAIRHSPETQIPPPLTCDSTVRTNMSDEDYILAGQRALAHIQAGDAFQIVLARSFERNFTGDPFDIYRVLRLKNPSPYMFYVEQEDTVYCGASPEIMIRVENNQATSCPLAGTRPRGEGYDDEVQAAELLADVKEVAEHMMLVDLARNDLGKVSEIGKIDVSAIKQIKKFSHVMHISSTVQAPLAKEKDALDALIAVFPAGTLSGAPKIRAMEIIETLEVENRGLYGGAIGFFDNRGNFDSCIAIRMAVIKNGKATVTAGAGITAESDLQKEADETRHKARAVLMAIAQASGGLS